MRNFYSKPKSRMLVTNRTNDICCLFEDGGVKSIDKKKLRRNMKHREKQKVRKEILSEL